MKKYTWFLLAIIFVFFFVIAENMYTPMLKKKKIKDRAFKYAIQDKLRSLDPAKITGINEMEVAMALFEGLTVYDAKTNKPIPGIAEKWEVSDDGLTYDFYLRKAKWSDGSNVLAQDFVYSWQRVLKKTIASEYAYQLFVIKNARKYYNNKVKFKKVGIKAVDKSHLQVVLEHPTPYFLDLTAFVTYLPVNKRTIKTFGRDWLAPQNMVCNGPFTLAPAKPGTVSMKKNQFYWDRDNVDLDFIDIRIVGDINTQLNMFEKGALDWIKDVPQIRLQSLKGKKELHMGTAISTIFVRFNVTKKPFNNPDVRKAFCLAINKNEIAQYGMDKPASSFVPPGIYDYVPSSIESFNAEKGKTLLKNYIKQDDNPINVTLLMQNTENNKVLGEALQNMWKNNLNVNVEIIKCDRRVYFSKMNSLDYDLCLSSWIGDYMDPNTFLDIFTSNNGNNRCGWSNPDYDELINKASLIVDNTQRYKIFNNAEDILLDELPFLPLYYDTNVFLLNVNVSGLYENLLDYHPFKFLKKVLVENEK